jgi:hypothetical protein
MTLLDSCYSNIEVYLDVHLFCYFLDDYQRFWWQSGLPPPSEGYYQLIPQMSDSGANRSHASVASAIKCVMKNYSLYAIQCVIQTANGALDRP